MRVNLGIWDKLTKLVIFLLFVAGIGVVFFWYLPLIQENQRYRKEILALDARIAEQEKLSRHLRAAIDLHQNDSRTIERLAREKTRLGSHQRDGGALYAAGAPLDFP